MTVQENIISGEIVERSPRPLDAVVGLHCPYCGGVLRLRDNAILYGGKSLGNSYICENYPKCDTYVGVHRSNSKPLGTPADKELRELRKLCHKKFDPMWRDRGIKRKEAYRWLSKTMNVKIAHIAEFTKEQCREFLGNVNPTDGH
jgi:ssDNA-binding Zn-finger/Zn-ribbon topoisomerase 1